MTSRARQNRVTGMTAKTTKGRLVKVVLKEPVDGRTEWYFGSYKAIFAVLTPEQVGTTLYYIYHYAKFSSEAQPLVTETATISYVHYTRMKSKGTAGNEC